MTMKTRNIQILIVGLILISFLMGAYLYPNMPEKMASHWDANGRVNGYMPELWGLFLLPVISAVLLLAFMLIPKIDPLKANIEKFRGHFDLFVLLLFVFLLYIHMLTLLWNIGYRFNFIQYLAPALGMIFYYSGVMIESAKQNWFIGVRTPWTLSSEVVWDKTNKLAGKLFKVAGVLAAMGVVFPKYAIFLILVPLILAAVYPIIYSYQKYQQEIRVGSRV
jgi:uncharacterized membrane protein